MPWSPARALASPQPEDPGRSSLQTLSERYSGVKSVAYRAKGTSGDGKPLALRVVARSDGAFRVEHYSADRARGASWESLPHYVVAHDGQTLRCSRNEGGSYQEFAMDLWAAKSPGPVQMIYAPWVFLDRVIPNLLADPATVLAKTDGTWSARNDEVGVSIEWSDQTGLRRFTRRADGPGFSQEIAMTASNAMVKAGEGFHESIRTGVFRGGREVGSDNRYTFESFEPNPPDIDSLLAFDPVKLGLNRFDPATKNVYDPSGNLLYNEDAVGQASGGLGGVSALVWPGLAVVAAGSAVLAWRRLRRPGA